VITDDQPDRFEAFAEQGSADLLQLVDGAAASAPQEPFLPCFGSLEEWVESVFAPTYARRTTPTFRWCGEWWRHPEAISRLEALWRSWEALRLDPLLGMSTWYSGHLDHQLPILTAAAGPFAECDPTRHFPPETDRLAHVPAPADWWPPARG
jgi:hypothetical protein